MNGILPLWKPKGITSHDCVVKVRRILGTKKVGHTGTLDPGVEGVLAICIGEATKLVPYMTAHRKTYEAEITLGLATTTEDSEGEVVEEKQIDRIISEKEIDHILQSFQGEIIQVPPMYSAVKVKGKKLYEYAREGKQVERPRRNITIYHIERLSPPLDNHRFYFLVECSQGTYIRTLCVDIGKKLGYPAHMSNLIRTQAASFTKKDTVTLEELENAKARNRENEYLLPLENGLPHLDQIHVTSDIKEKVSHGQKLPKPNDPIHSNPFAIFYKERLIAIYQLDDVDPSIIRPVRVFN